MGPSLEGEPHAFGRPHTDIDSSRMLIRVEQDEVESLLIAVDRLTLLAGIEGHDLREVALDRRREMDDAACDLEDRGMGDQPSCGFGAGDGTTTTASPDSPRVAGAEGDAVEPGFDRVLEPILHRSASATRSQAAG